MSAERVVLPTPRFPVIFAAPSGAGKTSIAHGLGERRDDVMFSISATTRPPRSYEQDGVDYHFRSEAEFRRMIDAGELLEWARVHGNYYGTPRANLQEARARDCFLVLDIDVQGSRQVRSAVPESVAIFVLPPSGGELARRLIGRGSEEVSVQQKRLRAARDEMLAASEFDYVIVNDSVERSVGAVEAILTAEARRVQRHAELEEVVRQLRGQVDQCVEPEPGRGGGSET